MSSHSNRRKRRQSQVPVLVERIQRTSQGISDLTQSGDNRLSYEEANWAKLSPAFRATHNRLLQARGLPTIPPPKIDLYVAPPKPIIRPFDATDQEVKVALANAKFFDGGGMIMGGGREGFSAPEKVMKVLK